MSSLPSYFEWRKESGEASGLYPFLYDNESKVFQISDKLVSLENFDPYSFSPRSLNLDDEGIQVDEMPEHALLIPGFGNIIGGPRFHEWLQKNLQELEQTRDVMVDAYKSLVPEPEEVIAGDGIGHMGFAARPYNGQPGVELQVLGNCACLGPEYNGMYIREKFEHGFAAYDLHNADFQSQRASLYAGLGHIARLAEGREPIQGKLF